MAAAPPPAAGASGDGFDPTIKRRGPTRKLGPDVSEPTPADTHAQTGAFEPTLKRGVRRGPGTDMSQSGSISDMPRTHAGLSDTGVVLDSQRDRAAAAALARFHGGSGPSRQADGRYEVMGELARGGMGAVLSAVDNDLGRTVAMKVILGSQDGEARVRFLREAQIHGQLEHPNIVPVHELGTDSLSRLYFTMKLVRGESLAAKLEKLRTDLRRGRGETNFPMARRLDVFRKVCDAVAFAHSRNVVHRDLKPENIMVGEFGEVQVMDWGLARFIDEEEGGRPATELRARSGDDFSVPVAASPMMDAMRTMDGDVMGTPSYMAPEQARGEIHRIDERTDVYALGAILYELLCLSRAIPATHLADMLQRVMDGNFKAPRAALEADKELRHSPLRVPGELEAVVLKAMARSRASRYQSATALREDIDKYLEGQLVAAARYTITQRAVKWVRQNRMTVLAAAIVIVMATGGVIAAITASAEAARAQLEESLDSYWHTIEDAVGAADAVKARLDAGELESAIDMSREWEAAKIEPLKTVIGAELVGTHRPEWMARAKALPGTVAGYRREAMLRWADQRLLALATPSGESLAAVPTAARQEVAATFEQCTKWLEEVGDAMPAAEFAWYLARCASDRASALRHTASGMQEVPRELRSQVRTEEAEMVTWIARSYQLQPRSVAAGKGFLLLAERSLAMADADIHKLVMQFHFAWSVFARDNPALRPRALLGLIASLMAMQQAGETPFAPEVPAAQMALRAVMKLVTPQGELRPEVLEWMAGTTLAERQEVEQAARDWLTICRRLACWLPREEFNWGRVVDGRPRLGKDGVAYQVDFRDPVTTGLDPAIPKLTAIEAVNQDRLDAAFPGCTNVKVRGEIQWLPGGPPEHWLTLTDAAGQQSLVIVRDTENAEMLAGAVLPPTINGLHMVTAGDLDGDGKVDLVIATPMGFNADRVRSVIKVMYQIDRTTFTEPVLIDPPVHEQDPNSRSELTAWQCADLDGDGAAELLVSRGNWHVLGLQVFEFDNRMPRQTADVRAGYSYPQLYETDGGLVIGIVPSVSEFVQMNFTAAGEPIDTGQRFFRYDGKALVELPVTWPGSLDEEPTDWRGENPLVDLDGETHGALTYVTLKDQLTMRQRASARWLMFEGGILAPKNARPRYTSTTATPLRGGYYGTLAGITRNLRADDLEAVAALPLPESAADESDGQSDVQLQLARLLLLYGEPEAAVDEVKRALARVGNDGDGAFELHWLELQALQEAHKATDLLALAARLPVDSRYVPQLMFIVDTVMDLTGRVEDVDPLLAEWVVSQSITAHQRRQITLRRRPLTHVLGLANSAGIEVRGTEVYEDGKKTGTLADYWITNDPGHVQFSARPDGPWAVLSGGPSVVPGVGGWEGQAVPVPVIDDAAAGGMSAGLGSRTSGIPIRLNGPDLMISIEFEVPGLAFDAGFRLHMFPLGPAPRGSREFAECRVTGQNNVFRWELMNTPGTSLIDRRLRYDIEFLGSINLRRYTLSDVNERRVLAQRSDNGVESFLWRDFGIGVVSNSTNRSEIRIHRIAVRGATLLKGDASLRAAWVGVNSPSALASRAVRAQLAGDPQQAAGCITELADWLSQAEKKPEAAINQMIPRLRVEAAWQASGGNGDAFADRLIALFGQGVSEDEAMRWSVARPMWGAPAAIQAGIGAALIARHFPDLPGDALLQQLAQEPPPVDPTQAAYMVAAIEAANPGNTELAWWHTYTIQRAWTMGGINRSGVQPLMFDLLERSRGWRQTGEFVQTLRQGRCLLTGFLHRRAELESISQPGDEQFWSEVLGIPHYVKLHQMMHAEGLAMARRMSQALEERGVRYQDR